MSFRQGTEEYYQKFIELQEKLRKSEEERLNLEMKFNEMVQHSRDEEQAYYHKLRSNYKQFLEENKKRQERNDKILRLLERIESRAAVLEAKSQRFKFLRKHYQNYLDVQSRSKSIEQSKPQEKLYDLKLPETESKEELLKKYFDQLDEVKSRYSSDKATAIADDIMNAIYKKNTYDNHPKYSMGRFEANDNYLDNNNQSRLRNQNVNFNLQQSNPALRKREDYCGTDRLNRRDNLPTNKYPMSNYSSDESGAGDIAKESSVCLNKLGLDKFAADIQNFHSLIDTVKIDEECGNNEDTQVETFVPNQLETRNKTKDEMKIMDNNVIYRNGDDNNERKIMDYNNSEVISRNGDDNIRQTDKTMPNKNSELIREQTPLIQQHDNKNEILEQSEMNVDNGMENNQNNMEIQNSFENKNNELDKEEKGQDGQLPQITDEQYTEDNDGYLLQSQPSQISNEENPDKNIHEASIHKYDNLDKEHYNNGQSKHYDDTQEIEHLKKDAAEDMEYTQGDQIMPEASQDNDVLNQLENDEILQTSNQSENQPQFLAVDQQNPYDENGQAIQYDENEQPIGYDSTLPMQPVQYESNVLQPQFENSDQPVQYNSGEAVQNDDNGQQNQFDTQQYDSNGQPLPYESNTQKYDANGQPIKYEGDVQQYDGQPLKYEDNAQEYDANGQPIMYEGDVQQYDANSQPIQYDQNGQPLPYESTMQPVEYDANNQPIQYDENGHPIQYGDNGQPLQYDENSKPIQYDENGQPIPFGNNGQPLQYDENSQPIQYDENGQPVPFGDSGQPLQYDENNQQIQYDENGQPIQFDENGQPIHYDQYGRQIHYDESGQAFLYDETGNLIPYTDYSEEQYAKDETSVLNSEVQETTDMSAIESSDTTFGDKKDQEDGKKVNVLDLLETDSESKKQEDSAKISNESDFEFSNNS